MTDKPAKGPATYVPSIERTYGRPIAEWQAIIRARGDLRHMELVRFLKEVHGMGHGHANALVAHTLATDRGRDAARRAGSGDHAPEPPEAR